MRSAEFEHGPYTIKTFAIDGEVRGRVFLDGAWMRDIPDCVADTLDDTVQHIRRIIDQRDDETGDEPVLH
ncbi:hypothetical protein [Roseomonas haemaphysalidis]|uniref:Uncharacterized protein n=1 Tax=Roseomonas haemaphysalidis TaxID=2768162 RepID=A0ABS3KL34_9PROT|nr:hypothetical protein [Roseomonas haemaphysalidis]MBO1078169.1 hypothetical protein [Roseomonas haemaphysalidis]